MKPSTMKSRAEKSPQTSPWTVQQQGDRYAVLDANGFWVCDVGRDKADALHIATSHPQAVIELVDKLEAAEAEVTLLRAAAKTLADAADHCRHCQVCGDGPCCDLCGSEAASERVAELVAKVGAL